MGVLARTAPSHSYLLQQGQVGSSDIRNNRPPPPHSGASGAVGMGECARKHGTGQGPPGTEPGRWPGQLSSALTVGLAPVCQAQLSACANVWEPSKLGPEIHGDKGGGDAQGCWPGRGAARPKHSHVFYKDTGRGFCSLLHCILFKRWRKESKINSGSHKDHTRGTGQWGGADCVQLARVSP